MKKIFLLGPDSPVKQMMQEELRQPGSVAGPDLVCGDPADEITQEDSVMLFGRYAAGERTSDLKWTEELSEAIGRVGRVRPRRVLFVSDLMVYGKVFGEQRLLREDEIGYVCHTAADSTAAQWMRIAEHLCTRLAREEGLAVTIVRADWEQVLSKDSEAAGRALVNSALGILEKGRAGEAYNLSALPPESLMKRNEACAKRRSPLSAVTVIPDTGKAENYAAS